MSTERALLGNLQFDKERQAREFKVADRVGGDKKALVSLKRKPWALYRDSRNNGALIPPPEGSALCKHKAISVREPEQLLGCSGFRQLGRECFPRFGHKRPHRGHHSSRRRVSGYVLSWQQNLPVSSTRRWFAGIQNAKVRGQRRLASRFSRHWWQAVLTGFPTRRP